jgi:hypothetical protein
MITAEKLTKTLGAVTIGVGSFLALSQPAEATTALVTFDPSQGVSQGPSTYVAAGAQQTINTTPATFTGGVVLGFATFFPAIAYATAPNVYGTADFGVSLSKTLNIAVNPGFQTTEVSFALFNGETFAQTYQAFAYNGSTLVASQTLSSLAANFNSGWGTVDLKASNITSVVVQAAGLPSVFDFLIDTVAFNQSLSLSVLPTPVTPPPTVFTPPPPVVYVNPETEVETEVQQIYGSDNVLESLRSKNYVPAPGPVPGAGLAGLAALALAGLYARTRRA